MSETTNEDSGAGRSVEENPKEQRSPSELAPSTSSPYLDIDDDDDDKFGPKPSELFGRNAWKIDNFSKINQWKLCGEVFQAGGYNWFMAIYPQGRGVSNHLSLSLCVADYEILLPGWSHLAQFTVSLINKLDPQKSKHSDLLHRFWKKETARGWNEFIELPKLHEGFIYDDSILIGVQIQVIRDRVDRPFRCLDYEYRRELVTVFANLDLPLLWFVEGLRRKYIGLIEDKLNWNSFCAFWLGLDQSSRRQLSREKREVILKAVVKQFFSEDKITYTSAFVMEFLYSGLKALEGQTKDKKSKLRLTDTDVLPDPIVTVEKDMFVLADDVISLIHGVCLEPFPPKEVIGHQTTRDGNAGEVDNDEAINDAERHLVELGRRTMEVFVLGYIYINKIEVAYREDLVWRRQEELIREEEEAKSKEKAEKEKKQAKQKKNKGKAKKKEDTVRTQEEERLTEKEEFDPENQRHSLEQAKLETKDVVPNREAVPSSSSSSSPDIQWQTCVSRGDIQITASPKPAAQPVQSMSRRVSPKQAAPVVSAVPNRKPVSARSPSSGQASSSRDIQLQTVVSEAYIQKTASPKPVAQSEQSMSRPVTVSAPVTPRKQAAPVVSSVQTSISPPKQAALIIPPKQAAPIIPPKQAALVVSAVQTSTPPFAPSMSSAGRLGSPPHSQTYIPQSYKPVIVGSSGIDHSSSQPTVTSSFCSHPPPVSVSNQSAIPINFGSWDVSPINFGSWDVSSGGLLLTGGSSSKRDTTTTTISGNNQTNPYNTPVTSSIQPTNDVQFGRTAQSLVTDEYPHLDIINNLLEDEYGWSSNRDNTTTATITGNHPYNTPVTTGIKPTKFGRTAQSLTTDEYPHLDIIHDLLEDDYGSMDSNVCRIPQLFNDNQYSYHGTADLWLSGMSQSYSEYMPYYSSSSSSSLPYGDGQMDGLAQTQWEMANMDMSLLAMGNQDDVAILRQIITDEYPHLDIIHDLLEEYYGSMDSNVYRIPQRFNNNQYSYHGTADLGISGGSQSYSEYMPPFSFYSSWQMDELAETQRQMANMDMNMAMRNQDDAALASASDFSYFSSGSSLNPDLSSGINGYRDFRPWTGNWV